jgi:hypothetical protein
MQPDLGHRFHNEYTILIAILLLALVNGLFYVFIVPPWQHYDEPNHFEYSWLLAERGARPQLGDYDTGMRQQVARSMIEHGFFSKNGILPDLTSEKPWIGRFSQLAEPALYYQLVSIPLRLLTTTDISSQLYTARLVSLALFLATILAGYGLVTEFTSAHHPLRFLVPLTMALLPAFVDLMTSVNNDVGAIAVFSLLLWGSIRLVRRGPSYITLLWVLATTALCLLTKRTVFMALPLLGIALLFAFLRDKYRKLAWGSVLLMGIIAVLAIFTWGDAALWYRSTHQTLPTRASMRGIPDGNFVFRISIQPGDSRAKLVQILPPNIANQLSAKPYTLGAWMWASQPIEAITPQLRIYDGAQTYSKTVSISENPIFFALDFVPNGDTRRSWVVLQAIPDPGVSDPVEIYFDGVVLVAGSYPVDQAPQFDQESVSGTWGDKPFENLLRNGSAERSWPYLRPRVDKIFSRFFSDYERQEGFSLTIYSLIDLQVTYDYYLGVLTNLFRTFWAKFGWAQVPLLGGKPYRRVLLPLTLLACIGIGLSFWQNRHRLRKIPWDALFLLGFTMLIFWGITLVRGATYLLTRVYVPVARYAYPAIIPTILFLSGGWLTLLKLPERRLGLPGWLKYIIYLGFLLLLNALSLVSINRFYG